MQSVNEDSGSSGDEDSTPSENDQSISHDKKPTVESRHSKMESGVRGMVV
jgi:hypothetical protein